VSRKIVAPLGMIAAVPFALALVGSTSVPTGSPGQGEKAPSGNVIRVTIHDFAFSPSRIVVKPGETIEVTNHDGVAHTLSSISGDKATFTTGSIVPNQTREVEAPMTPGTYRYDCQIHPFMTGTLIVEG